MVLRVTQSAERALRHVQAIFDLEGEDYAVWSAVDDFQEEYREARSFLRVFRFIPYVQVTLDYWDALEGSVAAVARADYQNRE